MANLAALRLRFVDIIGRLDFLTGGKATNTDNGANDFLQRAVRELDVQAFYLSGGDKNRKFVKVLAEGDYTFTIPEFLELDGLRMVTATGERDMTDGRLDLREFRNRHNRPYSDWGNGTPFDWAINDDILVEEMESSVPQSALGQSEVRRVPSEGEILNNASFDDAWMNPAETIAPSILLNEVPGWGVPNQPDTFNLTDKTLEYNSPKSEGNVLLTQDVDDMRLYPDVDVVYRVEIVISSWVEGGVTVAIGDDTQVIPESNGTHITTLKPTTYATDSDFRVFVTANSTINFTIESVSLKEVGLLDTSNPDNVLPEDVESRKGIIFFPPTDEARTVEVYGKFFTPKMTRDTDVNFWSTMLPDLVAFKAAELYYSDLGNSARVKHFMDLIAQRIDRLDSKDALQEDNDAAGINQQPFRGVPEKWKA